LVIIHYQNGNQIDANVKDKNLIIKYLIYISVKFIDSPKSREI